MRRIFRRQARKGFARQVPPILQEANLAFDKGEFGRAAELFERIAEGADARGGPRAPLLHLQAGRARIYAGQTALGIPSLKRGLGLYAERQQFHRLINAKTRVLSELKERGLVNEAAEIEAWLKTIAPSSPEFETAPPPSKKPVLPTHCPQCGAALRPDEVEWLDEVTAECGYCGSPVREENP
ncbi:MAG: hypothetical protein MHPDNHAH_01793 [Anaerolineales bacterium]|nr:hypothetical protein [Anaerolineales bacterium]WKZ49189.1 MAG: hypothetical protein QY306_07450 [Anaerolineales bacterium]